MFDYCFYSVQDTQTSKYYNKNSQKFDQCNSSNTPLLTLEESQKICEIYPHAKITLHEDT